MLSACMWREASWRSPAGRPRRAVRQSVLSGGAAYALAKNGGWRLSYDALRASVYLRRIDWRPLKYVMMKLAA